MALASPYLVSRQTSMWNLTSSWEKAATINPSFASLKGNHFKESPLSKSEQSETTCSVDDGSSLFINIFFNNIVFVVYNIYSTWIEYKQVSPLFVHAIFDKNLERQVTEWCTREVGLTFLDVWSTAAGVSARSLNNLALNYKDADIFVTMNMQRIVRNLTMSIYLWLVENTSFY